MFVSHQTKAVCLGINEGRKLVKESFVYDKPIVTFMHPEGEIKTNKKKKKEEKEGCEKSINMWGRF